MTTIKAHFDGKVFVPEEPVNLDRTQKVTLQIRKVRSRQKKSGRLMTANDILRSGLVGLWKDRSDIEDSAEFARTLRQKAQTRARH